MNRNKVRARRIMQSVLLMLVLMMSFMTGGLPAAKAQTLELFNDAGDADVLVDQSSEAFVMRSRFVTVNMNMLDADMGSNPNMSSVAEIGLNLFEDVNYTGVITKVERNSGSISWIGKLAGVPGSYFYLVDTGGVFIAHVASEEGIYEVSSVGGEFYQVIQIDQSQFVDHSENWKYAPSGKLITAADLPNRRGDSAARIDIIVFYTTAARTGEGSAAAMRTRIALAVTETNDSYANSGVTPLIRLVHTEEIAYTESGDIGVDVSRLAATADGQIDIIHSIRDVYGADLVLLVVENGGGYCGMADAILASASTAFAVVARSGCMTGYYSFGHEMGHLQGARHDVYVDSTTTPYTYGHGYVFLTDRWRTIMAYNTQCADTSPYTYCNRLQYWSSTYKTYGGHLMGNSTAQDYAVLNNTAFTVANFRSRVISDNFDSTFDANKDGWWGAPGYWYRGTWSPTSGYLYSNGLTNTFANAKYYGPTQGYYGDLTYEVQMYRTGDASLANAIIIHGNPGSLVDYNNWKPSYYFQWANDGTYNILAYNSTGSTYTVLKSWTTTAAIVKNGWNVVKVVAVGNYFRFYINGTYLAQVTGSVRVGYVGFGFYRSTNTGTLYINYAKLTTTPTAFDQPADAIMDIGDVLFGGTPFRSPGFGDNTLVPTSGIPPEP